MKFHLSIVCLALIAAAWAGCSHLPSSAWAVAQTCHPLGGGPGEDCLLPFPSNFYLRADPKTPTGARIDLSHVPLPTSRFGVALDPKLFDHRDGFSPASPLLAYFPERIDDRPLPRPGDAARALRPESAVQLLRWDTGERVPLFAELDANAAPDDKQALIVQPLVRLAPKTRYVAVIQNLRTREGRLLPPLTGFQKLRDKSVPEGSALTALKEKYEGLFAFLGRHGVTRAGLQLAWDFTTGSDESVVGRMVRLRDEARRRAESRLPSQEATDIEFRRVTESPTRFPNLLRRLEGSFRSASFLVGGDGARLHEGADGEPEFDRFERFPLVVSVPECARLAHAPLPVVMYGHGTYSTAEAELDRPYTRELLNRLCAVGIGTNWLGRARSDLAYFLFRVLPNWNNLASLTERLQQAHLNMVALARLVKNGVLGARPELQWKGHSLVDKQRLYFYGISEGGCQGVTTLALSPDIDRAALNVPCGFWSLFFWRSSDFHLPRKVLKLVYPGTLEEQKLMVLSQLLWDYTDPANYGAHLLRNPLAGNRPKRILYQEGINDASVPNLTTRAMARTIGLKLLKPAIEPVPGIEAADGPLDSAYVQYDVGVRPRLGADNVPPEESSVHEEIRELEAVKEQIARFFREKGRVEETCGGHPCLFEPRAIASRQQAVTITGKAKGFARRRTLRRSGLESDAPEEFSPKPRGCTSDTRRPPGKRPQWGRPGRCAGNRPSSGKGCLRSGLPLPSGES